MDKLAEDFEALLDAGDRHYASENYDDALTAYDRSLRTAVDDSQRAEAYCAIGDSLMALGRSGEAVHMYAQATDLDDELAGGYCGQADVEFERWNLEGARRLVESALARDADYARAHYLLGLICEKQGASQHARRHFQSAFRLDPEYYPLPREVTADELESAVAQALDALPESVRPWLEALEIELQELPSREDASYYRAHRIGPQVPGVLLETVEGADSGRLRLILYAANLAKLATTADGLVDEVGKTILAELDDLPEQTPPEADSGE